MNFSVTIILLILCSKFSDARVSESLQVRIDDGRIIGRYMTSFSGKVIRAFMGIPYASPPLGELRFKSPAKPIPWFQKSLLAHNEPPMCTQVDPFNRPDKEKVVVMGQEDCLYLNVYTPEINNSTTKKLPVMFWIHGGGWITGHGGHTSYGPDYFLEHDIVLVTGNYRLGPLGFLSTEDENASGNFGFKDQLMMLEWIQMNIEKFGGDGRSVTILGESAGGVSVNYHMFSSMSRGLFHRAISQSGNLMNPWADPARKGLAKMNTIRLADKMNCSITATSMKEIVGCLRKLPARKITAAALTFIEWDTDPIIVFGPVLEESELEEEPFIMDLRYKKHSLDIPWLVGVTSEEGLFKTAGFLNSVMRQKDLVDNWDKAIPLSFYFDHLHEDDILELNVLIYDYYFKENFLTTTRNNLTHLWSDGWFIAGLLENLEIRLRDSNRDNTYVYLFSHKGPASFSEYFNGGGNKFYGTCHSDELYYLFPMQKSLPEFFSAIPSEEDKKLIQLMTKLWVNFAITGTPTPEWNSNSEFPFWSPANKFPLNYMQIGNENGNSDKLLSMKKGLFEERAGGWKGFKEKFNLSKWKTETLPKDEL